MKRIVDLLVSILGLLILFPVIMIFVFLIYLEDRHNPFYIAKRIGKGGLNFKMIKLRSMVINADKNGVDSTSINDSRITKIGQKVRKYKLDEIPQLWNVLIGDMSLVGPRPCLFSQRDLLAERKARGITMNKPGITGLGQLHGIDMRNPKRLACLDRRMMSSLSLESYFKYLSKTVCSLIVCKKNVSISKLLS